MMPLIRSGKIRALASAGAQRLSLLPDVPTVAEAGIPGFDISLWVAVSAPKGTPSHIVNKINKTIETISAEPQYQERAVEMGCNPFIWMSPADTKDFIAKEVPRWVQRVRDANLQDQ